MMVWVAEATSGTITQEELSIFVVPATTANPDGNYTNFSSLFNGTQSGDMSPDCIVNGSVQMGTECGWVILVTVPQAQANKSSYVNTLRMMLSNTTSTAVLVIDYVAHVGVGVYTLDPSHLTSSPYLVQTQALPTSGDATPIDTA